MSHLFTFRDADHVLKFMESPIAERIETELTETARLRPITYFLRGPRYLTSNKPIETVDDVQGFKLRVPDVRMFIADWSAIGANPTPMAFAEVFTALQTGVIDGQENPFAQIWSAKFQEVQDYLSLTGHVYTPAYVLVGKQKFESLPPEVQQVLEETAKETQAFVYETAAALEDDLLAKLKEGGIQVNEADKDAFIAASQPIYDEFSSEVENGKELIDKALSLGSAS